MGGGMNGGGMAAGSQMMGGTPGMLIFCLLYILAIILFFWLAYRGVLALEAIAENTEDQSDE